MKSKALQLCALRVTSSTVQPPCMSAALLKCLYQHTFLLMPNPVLMSADDTTNAAHCRLQQAARSKYSSVAAVAAPQALLLTAYERASCTPVDVHLVCAAVVQQQLGGSPCEGAGSIVVGQIPLAHDHAHAHIPYLGLAVLQRHCKHC